MRRNLASLPLNVLPYHVLSVNGEPLVRIDDNQKQTGVGLIATSKLTKKLKRAYVNQISIVTKLKVVKDGWLTQVTQHCAVVHTVIFYGVHWKRVLQRKALFLNSVRRYTKS